MSQAQPETCLVQSCQCVDTRSTAKHSAYSEQRSSLNMQVEQVRTLQRQQRQVWLKNHCCVCNYCRTRLIDESQRLNVQVPDAEFFAVEQALLAAGRQLAAKPRQSTYPAANVRKLPASVTFSRKPSAMQQTGPLADGKKRKLPPSFAQQQHTGKVQGVQAGLHYKVHVGESILFLLCVLFCPASFK